MQENWGPGYVKESLMIYKIHFLKDILKLSCTRFIYINVLIKNYKYKNTFLSMLHVVHFGFPLTFFKMSRHFWLQLVIMSFPLQLIVPFPNLTSMHSKNDKITKLYYTTNMMHKIYF